MSEDSIHDDLEAFIRKALLIQLEDRESMPTEAQLKEIAVRAGFSEEDWNRLCEELESRLAKGRNFLKFGNYEDAIAELDAAAALAPYRVDVLHDSGCAHFLKGQRTGDQASRDRAEERFRKCLHIDASHAGAAQRIAELKSSGKKKDSKQKLGIPLIAGVAAAIALICAWQFWPGSTPGEETPAGLLSQAVREYGGNRYLLVKLPMTRAEASAWCRKTGGRLVTVGDDSENAWLYETFGRAMDKMNAWLGASDAAEEGKWIWEDGSPIDFQKWAGGRPNDRGGEDGALMVANSDEWNDAAEAKKWWFFCEWDTWPPVPAPDFEVDDLKEILGVAGE